MRFCPTGNTVSTAAPRWPRYARIAVRCLCRLRGHATAWNGELSGGGSNRLGGCDLFHRTPPWLCYNGSSIRWVRSTITQEKESKVDYGTALSSLLSTC